MKVSRKYLLFFIFTFLILRFFPLIFFGKTLIWGDNYSLMVPGKIYIAENLKKGILPLWNSEILSGIPLINDINQSVLYFTTLLFYFFPPNLALNFSIIIHVFLVMMGTYFLVKEIAKKNQSALLGAILMGLSTQVSGSINNLSTIQSIAWFPWIAFLGLKIHFQFRYTLFFAFLVLFHFLAGYPQHVIYAIIFSVLLSAFYNWKKIKFIFWFQRWLSTAVLVILLSSVAWLPFSEMLLDSTRMTQSQQQSQVGSLKISAMVKMFFPYFFDKQSAGIKWGSSWSDQPNVFFYVGNFCLFLLFVVFFDKKQRQKKDWFYFLFILSTIIFSFGSYLPGFNLIQKIFPLLKIGRYPSMVLILANLALVIWVGEIFDSVRIKKKWGQIYLVVWLTILLISFFGFYFNYFNFDKLWYYIDQLIGYRLSNSTFHNLERDLVISKMITLNLFTGSSLALISFWAFWQKKKNWLIFIIGLDVLLHTQAMFFFAPKVAYEYEEDKLFSDIFQNRQYRTLTRNFNSPYTDYGTYWEAMTVRAPFSDSFVDKNELKSCEKLIHLRNGYTPNWNMVLSKVPMVHGYTTLLPKDYANFWASSNKEAPINFIDFIDPNNPKLSDWSVKYYLVDNLFEVKEKNIFLEIARNDKYVLYELPNTKARFRFENNQPVTFINFTENPNRLFLEFDNQNQQFLIVADRFDRNWQATINGQKVVVENFNGMRRINIRNGKNFIIFKFIPKTFYYGLFITLITSGGLMWYLLFFQKYKK